MSKAMKTNNENKFTLDRIKEVFGSEEIGAEPTDETLQEYADTCNTNIEVYKGALYSLEECIVPEKGAPLEVRALWMPKELRGKGLAHELLVHLHEKHEASITFTPHPAASLRWFRDGYRYGVVVQPAPDSKLKAKFCWPNAGTSCIPLGELYDMYLKVPHGIFQEALLAFQHNKLKELNNE